MQPPLRLYLPSRGPTQCACLHKIDLFHTGNNSLSTLNDWNLQGCRQSEERMKNTSASEMQPSV